MYRRKIRYLCAVDVKTPQGTNETKNLRIRIFNVSKIKLTNIFKGDKTIISLTKKKPFSRILVYRKQQSPRQ